MNRDKIGGGSLCKCMSEENWLSLEKFRCIWYTLLTLFNKSAYYLRTFGAYR